MAAVLSTGIADALAIDIFIVQLQKIYLTQAAITAARITVNQTL
jgi:hypothetical protein